MTRLCPFCLTHDGFEVALMPLPSEYPCMWRCVACGTEFDRIPEPGSECWQGDPEGELDQRQLARIYGQGFFSGRDAFLDSGELENRKRR